MTDSQIKIGFCLLIAQCILLVMTLGFKGMMDAQAHRNGIDAIIMEAGK